MSLPQQKQYHQGLFQRKRIRIKEILADSGSGYLHNKDDDDTSTNNSSITVCGWTRTVRKAGRMTFLELNDGSTGSSLQCICSRDTTEGFQNSKDSGGTGSSFKLTGKIVKSEGDGQDVELNVETCVLLGAVYGGDAAGTTVGGAFYPMSKKEHTLEHIRANAHLRARSGVHAAAMRIRHAMAYATHQFFNDMGFLYIHTPILTCADCEGAGEQFGVTTLLTADAKSTGVVLPVYGKEDSDNKNSGEDNATTGGSGDGENEDKPISKKELKRRAKRAAKASASPAASGGGGKPEPDAPVPDAVDYSNDFFNRRANLTVSGQLNVETHACALSDVYTFGPTFRAENSHTTRHLAEFWMIEPEVAFAELSDDIDLAEDYLKHCVGYALDKCDEDLQFFEGSAHGEVGLRDRLRNVIDNPFKRLTYTEAIEVLKKSVEEDGAKFEVVPEWGIDLPSEHERYLCEVVYKRPVVLTDYPKGIKAFYMKLNDDCASDRETVAAADILVPKIGEIIGGSQREHRLDVLMSRCIESGLDPKHVWWYLDLRKYGTVPHSGFGLGFERLVLFVTGLDNIRDVIPFPRWAGNAEF